MEAVPRFVLGSVPVGDIMETFRRTGLVLVEGFGKGGGDAEEVTREFVTRFPLQVAKNFSVEQDLLLAASKDGSMESFLGFPGGRLFQKNVDPGFYISFLLQNDPKVIDDAMAILPGKELTDFFGKEIKINPCIWYFLGFAPNGIRGRKEHTDSVSSDGTWHYQLSGTKTWKVRPISSTASLLERKKNQAIPILASGVERLTITCKKNSLFLIATDIWFHETFLPADTDKLSLSFARDFMFFNSGGDASNSDEIELVNLDAAYSPAGTGKGVCVFSEKPTWALLSGNSGLFCFKCGTPVGTLQEQIEIALKMVHSSSTQKKKISQGAKKRKDCDENDFPFWKQRHQLPGYSRVGSELRCDRCVNTMTMGSSSIDEEKAWDIPEGVIPNCLEEYLDALQMELTFSEDSADEEQFAKEMQNLPKPLLKMKDCEDDFPTFSGKLFYPQLSKLIGDSSPNCKIEFSSNLEAKLITIRKVRPGDPFTIENGEKPQSTTTTTAAATATATSRESSDGSRRKKQKT